MHARRGSEIGPWACWCQGASYPWSAILPMRLLISPGATLLAATSIHTHTPSVMDQGWRRGKTGMGLQPSQIVKPGRRSCRMWICINCIVLVQPREPSPAIMIEPAPLRGSGFSSIRSGLSSNAQRLVCPSESTTHRDPGRLIGLAFCHHHVRPSKRPSWPQSMSTSPSLWAFAAHICTTGLVRRQATCWCGFATNPSSPLSSFRMGVNVSPG